jgi:predicted nucleic acid-binding Zn ribbon protein
MPEQPPQPASDPGSEPETSEHRPDGLDLARAMTRASAGATPARRAKRRARSQPPSKSRGSGAHPDERDPQLLDDTMGRFVDDHGWELSLRVHAVFGRWAELVGAEVGDHSTPESFTEGRLVVRTDSTAWATQLRLLAPTVVRRLNEQLGHGTVTVIDVQGPRGPSWKKGPRSARGGRGPRDTYG